MMGLSQIQGDISFAIVLALQFAGLIPSLFVAALVAQLIKNPKTAAVPTLYFLVLAASFAVPLIQLTGMGKSYVLTLSLLESLQPALCFLMVVQCLTRRPPPTMYWLIMALPLIGGSSLLYLSMIENKFCLSQKVCLDTQAANLLYQMIGSCVVFLLLMAQINKIHNAHQTNNLIRRHAYWLMLALVGLNLCLFAADLALLAKYIMVDQHLTIASVLRISFIYLVITSLFRVFDEKQEKETSVKERPISQELVENLERLMSEEKIYREMGFSREALAEKLRVGEHVISRTINQHFGKNFNEYVNGFRIEEARERLSKETIAITVIAFEVGFSSIASFNRVFKQMVGISPTEYRVQNSGEKQQSV